MSVAGRETRSVDPAEVAEFAALTGAWKAPAK